MQLFRLLGEIVINSNRAAGEIESIKQQASDMANSIGGKLKSVGETVSGIGTKLMPLSIAVGAALGASVKSASDFNNGMAKMSTLFDTTQTSVSGLSKQFLELSNKTGISATELAEAGYQALSAGQKVEDVGKFVEVAGNLAKAGFTSTSTAVDVLTTAINAYGSEAGTAEEIANKLVRTQNLGKTTVDELASSMGKIIPTASAMGVNIDNLTAGYVSLTKQGIATAEATTYMNTMLNELGDSGTQIGGILKQKTGKSFQDLMRDGYSLGDVLKITKDYADENGIAYNELWGSMEGGKAALAILNGGVDEFNDTVGIMASKTDDVGDALGKLETPSVKAGKALNRIKNSSIELGTAFLAALAPVLDGVCTVIEVLTNAFNALPEPIKAVIASVMAIIAALGPVLFVVGNIIGLVGSFITYLPVLAGALSFLTGPVGIVIAVIAALVAAFIWLWNNCEGFRNFWIALWNGIVEMVTLAWGLIVEVFQTVWPIIQPIVQAGLEWMLNIWRTYFEGIFNVVSVIFNTLAEFIKQGVENFRTIIQIVTALIHGDWKGAWEGIQKLTEGIFKSIQILIQGAMDLVLAVIKMVLNNVLAVWGMTWDSALNAVNNIFNSIASAISNAMNSVANTIANIVAGIQNSFYGLLNAAQNAIGQLGGAFSGIQGQFYNVMNNIQSAVFGAANSLANAFNFSWQLPYIPLPHFWISGGFSLNPPEVPNFGIDWYDKAMNQPYLFEDPTLFGFNPVTGAARVAGETGDEMMYGRQNLMNDIQQAVATQNSGVVGAINNAFDKLFDILGEYFPEFTNTQLVLDTGVLVAETADKMDEQLGMMYRRRGRQ